MVIQSPTNAAKKVEVTTKSSSLISLQSRGNAFSFSNVTGTIAASLAANSSIFSMRLDPSAGNKNAYIERIRITFTCLVAYTVPLTAGRRLAVYRGSNSGVAMSGGTAITTVAKKHSTSVNSEFEAAQGGDVRISTTGALTVGGALFEANEFATMSLVHVGNAGNFLESVFEFNANESAPIVLEPGQILAIRNPAVMDAAGTWQASIRVDWYEEDSITI